MEKVLVLFSVPIFLLIVLLIAVFVLAKYSGNEQTAKSTPAEVKTFDTTEGENNVVTKE